MRRRSVVRTAGSIALRTKASSPKNAIASSTDRHTLAGVPCLFNRSIVANWRGVGCPFGCLTSIHRTSPDRTQSRSGRPARVIGPPCILIVNQPAPSAARRILFSIVFSVGIRAPVVSEPELFRNKWNEVGAR